MNDYLKLDDFINRPEKELYEKLKSIHKEVYPNDHKIYVEYNIDIINNIDYHGKYLELFIQYINSIDIPSFFIEIITAYNQIERDLIFLNTLYNFGEILHSKSDKPFVIQQQKKDTFCILPWLHFYINPQGKITPCCEANQKYNLGSCNNETVNFNSTKIKKFRRNLLNGIENPHCSTCYKKEELNIVSSRQKYNSYYKKYISDSLSESVDPFKMRYFEVQLSNICNMKCRMCSGIFSNKIAIEDYKIWGTSKHLQKTDFSKDKIFLNLAEENLNYIEEMVFAGGEPLINDIHYQILNLLINFNKTNIKISYFTNFSILQYKSYDLPTLWQKFDNVKINASIDLIGKASNYVRHGAEYSDIEQNYFLLKKECPTVNFNISSVLSMYNVFNLCDLQKHWIENIGLECKKIKFHVLLTPENTSLQCLPVDFKLKAVDYINQHLLFLKKYQDSNELISQWNSAVDYMMSNDTSHLLLDFFQSNDQRDNFRNQRFEDYFPEYKNLRNYAK